jgi:hypothetical protein
VRLFNCSATAIDNPRVFAEILYVLLSGAGVGFSVQSHHINALPKIKIPKEETRFLINDSIMGWAQSVEMLVNAYFFGSVRPLFDYSLIRPKGSYMVTTGAKAPGPAPLKFMLELVESKLKLALGRKLTSLECHDIVCIISDAVLAGGIRRCLPENSLVHTKRGLIRIQDVIVGEKDGVTIGSHVFAESVLPLGTISEVYPASSKVVLYSSNGEKNFVIVSGKNIQAELIGRGGQNFEMTFPRDVEIPQGTLVTLPGLSTYPLAVVEKVIFDPRDPFQKVLLRSPVNIQQLEWVQIEK